MDGEQNGTQTEQVEQQQENQTPQQQAQEQPETRGQHARAEGFSSIGNTGATGSESFEAQLAERDSLIEELEAQIAEAAKNAETADELRAEITSLRGRSADQRVEFGLILARCRNLKAVIADRAGDIVAPKAAEPWMLHDALAKRFGNVARNPFLDDMPTSSPEPFPSKSLESRAHGATRIRYRKAKMNLREAHYALPRRLFHSRRAQVRVQMIILRREHRSFRAFRNSAHAVCVYEVKG